MGEKRKIEYRNLDDLVPYVNNPRKNDEAVDKVAASISEFGFNVPIVIDKDNVIVTGHTRFKAARKLGLKEVPTIQVDDLTDAQVKAFRIADNKVSEFAEWDDKLLELEMLDLDELGFDLEKFGFEQDLEDQESEEKKKRDLESMELKAFEHYDYIVFVFDNQMDWLNVCNEFKLHKVNAGYGKTRKIGLGRVIRGKELLERLGHKAADIEQGEE